ncbi:MAG TPA: hypothetical protein VJR89_06625 [Polyangiales bacterium]|nr:hypothetical protein [Polyangiales bacterium]
MLLTLVAPRLAAAHFGPALPPDFGTPQCITVVDLRTTRELMLPYELPYDDNQPEDGHIWLKDSKSHEFYAFRGSIVPALPRYYYWSAAPGPRASLPLWIDADDLQRADAANDPSIAPDFHAADIGNNVLHARSDIAGQWLDVAHKRVPITVDQAMHGVVWDLTGVTPGVYQVTGYTFSPPFNAWEPRPGVIKIVDGTSEPPAVTLDSIDGMLYGGQGRKVTGCVDAPAGSTLTLSYSVETEGEPEWKPWRTAMPVTGSSVDVCFDNPEPQLAGIVRLRATVRTPAGLESSAYTPDVLVLVATPAACSAADTNCCTPAPPPAMPATTAMNGAVTAGPEVAAGAAPNVPPVVDPVMPPQTPVADGGGCAVSRSRGTLVAWGWLALSLALLRRRRKRAH